jgi:DNA repair exonuclease SbcCD ATPase subunit/DNA repair exonuclease SbcCD nuclease subunit
MRFAHLADTHIRNLKYHFEYREVFKQLYKSLKEEKVDCIVHCGDIAHTKTQISPEFVDMCREFFENLAAIAPTYIILGNHDGNLRNDSRQDAISPIVKAINNPNLILLRNAGETKLNESFCLNVLSVFDEENWTKPTNEDIVNIALYHGAIDKSKTDQNWTLGGDHDISIFDSFDFAFLGDIHKTQQLDSEGRIWYAGSTVQQNFGESLDKGYLLWDIESKEKFTNRLVTFVNPKPFITLELTKSGNLPRKKPPKGARLRIVSAENVTLDKVRKAVDIVKYRYSPESVTYLNRAAGKQIAVQAPEGMRNEDLRDLKTQESLISEYLKEFEVTDDVMKKVYDLNKKYNTQITEDEDVMRNVHWSLQSLEWDNLFNYGDGNSIDFTKLEGIVGIFGKNYSGKSSIVDTLLYSLYNSTSKSIRKNLNIINQNRPSCLARANIKIDDMEYVVERTSEKYTKRLKGVETTEASTDLEFFKQDMSGNVTGLNGTSRQDTDKNVRKYFGTLQDFLSTSMASQLDSLSFINEGSTKRKEFLAKFLDLDLFDRKFRLAKEDSALTKASLRRLEGIDFEAEIQSIKKEITKSELAIESCKAECQTIKGQKQDSEKALETIDAKIRSVPAEIIDPIITSQKIAQKQESILEQTSRKTEAMQELALSEEKFQKIAAFLEQFDIASYEERKTLIDESREKISNLVRNLKLESEARSQYINKQRLLSEVPCGVQFPTCKFIKDAHAAEELIQIADSKISSCSSELNSLGTKMADLSPEKVEQHLEKYNLLLDKRNTLATSIATSRLIIEKADALLFKEQVELEQLQNKSQEYEENKDAIENLKGLLKNKKDAEKTIAHYVSRIEACDNEVLSLHKKHGSLEQKLKHVEEQLLEYESLKNDFAAYHLLMTCCHPNGVSYEVIKRRLPHINQEIAKILTNIVDFEVFITNNEDKLDIFIKHPRHEPRPLEMGSGAEKTIASMAIRLAFLTVSSLPKSDLFILDEPGTALDEENMEGFVRILDMIKGYFKTVILISHLDSLKDCVDMQINIERKKGFAHVNI